MAAALLVRVGRYLIRYGQNSSITLDSFETTVTGLGGHAARPHKCIDSVLVGAQLITALQSIVSRSIDPLESAVILLVTEASTQTARYLPAVRVKMPDRAFST
jgi:metal-dependent amidase/aminoacylase/carboxypeptidase family protein